MKLKDIFVITTVVLIGGGIMLNLVLFAVRATEQENQKILSGGQSRKQSIVPAVTRAEIDTCVKWLPLKPPKGATREAAVNFRAGLLAKDIAACRWCLDNRASCETEEQRKDAQLTFRGNHKPCTVAANDPTLTDYSKTELVSY